MVFCFKVIRLLLKILCFERQTAIALMIIAVRFRIPNHFHTGKPRIMS